MTLRKQLAALLAFKAQGKSNRWCARHFDCTTGFIAELLKIINE